MSGAAAPKPVPPAQARTGEAGGAPPAAAGRARAGLLFDLDGTLATTEHLHRAAYETLLNEEGRTLEPETFATHIRGRSSRDVAGFLFPAADEAGRQRVVARKEVLFREFAAARGLVPTPGVVTLLDWARTRGVAMALVTNAPRANARMVLDLLGIAGYFDAIVSGAELARRKPFPDPYLAGLEALGLDAACSLAVEDSPVGVASARAAGLDVIAVASATVDDTPVDDVVIRVGDLADPRLFALLSARFDVPM